MKSCRSSPPRQGYVLLMTLALLVMSSTLLVTVGRIAVSHAASASVAQETLQRKWGTITCRNAVLPFAEPILLHVEADANVPMPQLRVKIHLTDQEFNLIIGDEQAKANVNAMLDGQTQGGVEDRFTGNVQRNGPEQFDSPATRVRGYRFLRDPAHESTTGKHPQFRSDHIRCVRSRDIIGLSLHRIVHLLGQRCDQCAPRE